MEQLKKKLKNKYCKSKTDGQSDGNQKEGRHKKKLKVKLSKYEKAVQKLADNQRLFGFFKGINRKITAGPLKVKTGQVGLFTRAKRSKFVRKQPLSAENEARKNEDINKIIDLGQRIGDRRKRNRKKEENILKSLGFSGDSSVNKNGPSTKVASTSESENSNFLSYHRREKHKKHSTEGGSNKYVVSEEEPSPRTSRIECSNGSAKSPEVRRHLNKNCRQHKELVIKRKNGESRRKVGKSGHGRKIKRSTPSSNSQQLEVRLRTNILTTESVDPAAGCSDNSLMGRPSSSKAPEPHVNETESMKDTIDLNEFSEFTVRFENQVAINEWDSLPFPGVVESALHSLRSLYHERRKPRDGDAKNKKTVENHLRPENVSDRISVESSIADAGAATLTAPSPPEITGSSRPFETVEMRNPRMRTSPSPQFRSRLMYSK